MAKNHQVMVRLIPGTEQEHTDRKGRVTSTTGTYRLDCACGEWGTTLTNTTEAGADRVAEQHEGK